MKKLIVSILCLSFLVPLAVSFALSVAADLEPQAVSPNQFRAETKIEQRKYYGFVQVQPSYNQNGKHAQAGWFQLVGYTAAGTAVATHDPVYTPYGTNQSDSRLLSNDKYFYVNGDPEAPEVDKVKTVKLFGGFVWQTHSSNPDNPWPMP